MLLVEAPDVLDDELGPCQLMPVTNPWAKAVVVPVVVPCRRVASVAATAQRASASTLMVLVFVQICLSFLFYYNLA